MTECTACGGHVSSNYVRVFGDATGAVSTCPSCSEIRRSGVG